MKNPVLIIEDNPDVVALLKESITELGYSLEHEVDGERGLSKALSKEYSLIILDINLPKMNGLDVCKKIRLQKEFLPIIMLTGKETEIDRVIGLEIGADDYVTKPFSVRELIARIKTQLRIAEEHSSPKTTAEPKSMNFDGLSIDLVKRLVIVNGQSVHLTVKEFEVLAYLAANAEIPISREQLLENVWSYAARGAESTINGTIARLRQKIEKDPEQPRYIKSVRGFGYCFQGSSDS